MANALRDFLPGSGRPDWKGHVTFQTVATKVGVGAFWPSGSKVPAITGLLSQTLERRRGLFQTLVLEIVRAGIVYREKKNQPIGTAEIDDLNGCLLELGFKFPDLWDPGFRASLAQTTTERAREHVRQEDFRLQNQSIAATRSQELARLNQAFAELSAEQDRNKAGLALEGLLNDLFYLFDLQPRSGFRVTGEQIDGSFELDGQVYLLEAKWEKGRLPEADLLVFQAKIQAKSSFTRGVFVALNDISDQARDAITRGKAPSFFVMNGYDLMAVLYEQVSFENFLRKRVRLLGEGRVCVPFHELSV
jgi:hypothetical protein